MARVLAIDYGTKRVGLAVTDPLQLIATALETVHSKDVITYLTDYFKKEEVEAIVVGLPKRLDNTDTHVTEHIRQFKVHLERSFSDKTITFIDERFTSKIALNAMIEGGMSKKNRKQKGTLDKLSAVVILQSYMESMR